MINTAVAGSTGLVGEFVIKKLISNDRFDKVFTFNRRDIGSDHEKIIPQTVNYEHINELDFNEDVQAAFCCLGTTMKKAGSNQQFKKVDHTYVVNFARKMHQSGVSRFVLISSIGADPNSKNFYFKVKGETEEAVKNIGFKKLIIMRPSLLYGPRKEYRFAERIGFFFFRILNPVMSGSWRNYIPVHANQVAGAAVQCLISEDYGTHIVLPIKMREYLK